MVEYCYSYQFERFRFYVLNEWKKAKNYLFEWVYSKYKIVIKEIPPFKE